MIKKLSKKDSTLAVAGFAQVLYPLTRTIQRTGLYERVAIISYSPNVYYKTIVGDIYRLKSFRDN